MEGSSNGAIVRHVTTNTMASFRVLPCALLVVTAANCFAQAPSTFSAATSDDELKVVLASGQPKEVAWVAYDVGRRNRRDLIGNLASLLDHYESETTANSGSVSPQAAAIQAVADALIQMKAKLPSQTVMHLYPEFPAQTIILLATSPDRTPALLQIFQTTRYRDLWLAADNLLAVQPTPEFVRTLLSGMVTTFVFRIVPVQTGPDPGVGGGCAGDFFMTADEVFQDWPRIREYRLITSRSPDNTFAPGIQSVGYSTWQTTDYRNGWADSDCTPAKSVYWRTGLLAQAMRRELNSIAVKPKVEETIVYSSQAAAEEQMKQKIATQSQRLLRSLNALFSPVLCQLQTRRSLSWDAELTWRIRGRGRELSCRNQIPNLVESHRRN